MSDDKKHTAQEMRDRVNDLESLVGALDMLLACYRIGKRPPEKLLNSLKKLREKVT